jgi:hypothetical protein
MGHGDSYEPASGLQAGSIRKMSSMLGETPSELPTLTLSSKGREQKHQVCGGRFIWHDVGVDDTYGSSTDSVLNV